MIGCGETYHQPSEEGVRRKGGVPEGVITLGFRGDPCLTAAMDPDARSFLQAVALADAPPWETLTPSEARARFDELTDLFLPETEVASVEAIRSEQGTSMRVYRPLNGGPKPLAGIVYVHGGGWVLGNVNTHDTLCRELAHHAGAVVVSVDYRLAPEHPFPTPLEDCQDALEHVSKEAQALGVDPQRMALAGDSAGGNLCAALSLKVRDEGGPAIAAQALLYPVMDARGATPSYEAFAQDHGLTRESMRWFWQCYLGEAEGDHPLASPLRAANLAGLPSTLVLTAGYDVLRDEGEAFADALEAANTPVTRLAYPDQIHGFIHFSGVIKQGRVALQETARWLAGELAR